MSFIPPVSTAFVLGAGLGTRLRPLTDTWPKPLLNLGGRPIITWIFDRVIALGINRIIVNTHHRPERYSEIFPDQRYCGVPLIFRHEPVLLETGGGIRNIADLLIEEEPLLVHNGDILANMPLAPLLDQHIHGDAEVTLGVRTDGMEQRIKARFHGNIGRVADIRNERGAEDKDLTSCQFTGVYMIARRFVERIPAQPEKISVVPLWLEMLQAEQPIDAVRLDEGWWTDIGTLDEFNRVDKAVSRGDLNLPSKMLA